MRIPMLSTLVRALIKVCKVIDVAAPKVRVFVPEEKLTDYDNALAAVQTACDVIRAIDYVDSVSGTSAPWGAH